MFIDWEQLYDVLGVKDFVYMIASPQFQAHLLPAKLVFFAFTALLLFLVLYFYSISSYISTHFLQDTVEFLSFKPYGLQQVNRRWQQLMKRLEGGSETEYKLAIIEADEFLYKTLEEQGYEGDTLEDMLGNMGVRKIPNYDEILLAHNTRNTMVYDPNFKIDAETVKKLLKEYEKAIKAL